jgi:hypothetical protein
VSASVTASANENVKCTSKCKVQVQCTSASVGASTIPKFKMQQHV